MRIKTDINGITTTSTFKEGDCRSLVNIRKKNGALHPVTPRKTDFDLKESYDIVFVHAFGGYENWIGVKGCEVYWIGTKNSDYNIFDPPNFLCSTGNTVTSIQQIGNTLSLITADEILYLLHNNDAYTFLGELPEIPPLVFSTVSTLETDNLLDPNVMFWINAVFDDEYGPGAVTPDNFITSAKGLVYKAMDMLINGNPNGVTQDQKDGFGLMLFDACFVRYAYRLYDGSLIKHSPPILILPIYSNENFKTIHYEFEQGKLGSFSFVTVNGYRVAFSGYIANRIDYSEWKDIIKSIDIFMSPPVGWSDIENIRNLPTENGKHDSPLIKSTDRKILDNIENASLFYFMKSIEIDNDDSTPIQGIFPSKDSSVSSMDALVQQELMSDDNFSHHKQGANVNYTYNNRLHIADIKTTFFKGFTPDFFIIGPSNYFATPAYNGQYSVPELINFICIEIELNINFKSEKVYSRYPDVGNAFRFFSSAFLSYPDPRAVRITIYEVTDDVWNRIFSAPLKEHKYLNLAYFLNTGLNPVMIEYTRYWDDILLNWIYTVKQDIVDAPQNTSNTPVLIEPNKLKVSALNDPFIFPNETTYLVSNGKILNMASVATRIAEGQFGQFPLYVFTDKGIYSMSVGSGEVVYSREAAPTSFEVPTSDVVCSTPFGVVFVSARGVCIISGQTVELLTAKLQQRPEELNLIIPSGSPEVIDRMLPDYGADPFTDYVQNIESVAYNPHENELIIIETKSPFNWVLNLSSKEFYQSTEKIDLVVQNTFPELTVIDGLKVKNFRYGETSAHVSLITRPLTFGTTDLKKIERMYLRTTLIDPTDAIMLVHFSLDEINFSKLRWTGIAPQSRKDVDTGLFARSKYRQFVFAFAGLLDEKSEIRYLETEVEKEYGNDKMR